MAQIKKVILKDTMSGDQLFPATSIDMLYNTDGTKWTPPTIPSPLNADQLQGHEASYFGTATQYTELSSKYDQLFQSVSNGKSLIASAITGKGVSTASDATFQQMATNIGNIQTGNCISGAASNITTESKFDDQRYNYLVITISNPLITTNFNRALIIFNVKNLNLQEQQGCLFYSTNKSSYVYEYGDGRSSYNATFTASIGTGKIIFTSNKVYSASGGNPFFPSVYSPYMWFVYKV